MTQAASSILSRKFNPAEKIVRSLLESADIAINGSNPWDIHINHPRFYNRVLKQGVLGLGESYMDHWWHCERLDMMIDKALRLGLDAAAGTPLRFRLLHTLSKFVNKQTKKRAIQVADTHYNLGNDLFTLMLDRQMIYSCGYWKDANNLDDAQIAKLDLICKKLQLKPGSTLLDIGCGWGGLAKYAALNYDVSVTGVTISKQQYAYAVDYCKDLPIEIKLQDYRDIQGQFDNIVSVGMFEHVGCLNYPTYMKTVNRLLKDDGLFLLHTIGANKTNFSANEWTIKYIFPNGMLPSIKQIADASEESFVMEDWHNFGAYYDNTLMAWHANFIRNWGQLKDKYGERFYRMWNFYLLSSAGDFRARSDQLWQIVFSKKGRDGGYCAVR